MVSYRILTVNNMSLTLFQFHLRLPTDELVAILFSAGLFS